MPKNVTIKDIAAEAGVSIALVSFVMNNRIEADGRKKYRVNEQTRQRILEVARRLNYQPNAAARTLRRGKALVIGVILSDISNVFYGEMAKQLEEVAFQHGYTVLFGSTDETPEKFDRVVRSFLDRGVEGFIAVPCEGAERSLKHILNVGVPLVIIDRKDIDIPAPKVVLDNEGAMHHAVSLLMEKGLRKIEMVSYTMRVSSISGREAGFINSLRAQGFAEDDIVIHRLPFESIISGTDKIIPSIVERKVEGVVFATNSLAIAAIRKLAALGVKIQEDIHLVGFDHSDVYSLFNPPIPHIKQPVDQICLEAFTLLKRLIDREMLQESRLIVLNGEAVNKGLDRHRYRLVEVEKGS